MAGECTSCGITQDEDGKLTIDGARSVAWGFPVSVTSNNGLRCDPVGGDLWVPPDAQIITGTEIDNERNIVPTDTDSIVLDHLELTVTAPAALRVMWALWISGGYAGFRMGDGNFWTVTRYITTYEDGVPTNFTGTDTVAACENSSTGGVTGHGGTVDAISGMTGPHPAGSVLKALAHYELNPTTQTDSPGNGFAWRPPRITSALWTIPTP